MGHEGKLLDDFGDEEEAVGGGGGVAEGFLVWEGREDMVGAGNVG